MRKRIYGRKLGRTKDARKALLRGLLRALVREKAIETSEARAKTLKSYTDKVVSRAKKNGIATRRALVAQLGGDEETVRELYTDVLPKLKGRVSGFTRIIKLGERRGDRSRRVKIEWSVNTEDTEKSTKARSEARAR